MDQLSKKSPTSPLLWQRNFGKFQAEGYAAYGTASDGLAYLRATNIKKMMPAWLSLVCTTVAPINRVQFFTDGCMGYLGTGGVGVASILKGGAGTRMVRLTFRRQRVACGLLPAARTHCMRPQDAPFAEGRCHHHE